jgi:hypothetical protein
MTDETPETKKQKKAPLRPRNDGPSAELQKRRAERLSRGSVDHTFDQRLSTAGAVLDHDNYKYRWVNQEHGRVQRMEAQEYEIVTDEEMNGLEKARHAGLSREGRPMNSVLMKKYKPWFEEDQARKTAESREQEQALKRGKHALQSPIAPDDPEAEKHYALKTNQFTVATPTKAVPAGDYTP